MNQRTPRLPALHTLIWFALGLAVYGLASRWIASPGYMDADYYYATGIQLQAGRGFAEPFLWNYLDDPAGIPHPSHLYWMPLPSLVASAGMELFGRSFRAAQVPFVLTAAMLPPVIGTLGLRLSGNRGQAWKAAVLAAFPGFFLPYFVTSDAFALYALIGGLGLWTTASAARSASRGRWLLAGALVGLANLARADAPLLLITALIAIIWISNRKLESGGMLLIGYLLLIAPWWARNYAETGSIVNPGSARLFWLLEYDDLFSYPASLLTFERWQTAGLGAALSARLAALATNLQRLLAENGMVYLAPFVAVGAWRLRTHAFVRVSLIYLTLLLAAMTVVYPFVGARGGLFHSGTALMPAVWMLAPIGVERATRWLGSRRGWNPPEAQRVFGGAAVALAAVLTIGLFYLRQIKSAAQGRGWAASAESYAEVAAHLAPGSDAIVAVNNPPGLYLQSGHPTIVIPNGDLSVLRAATSRYGAGWVVLEANQPRQLADLYQDPDSADWIRLRATIGDSDGHPIYVLEVLEP